MLQMISWEKKRETRTALKRSNGRDWDDFWEMMFFGNDERAPQYPFRSSILWKYTKRMHKEFYYPTSRRSWTILGYSMPRLVVKHVHISSDAATYWLRLFSQASMNFNCHLCRYIVFRMEVCRYPEKSPRALQFEVLMFAQYVVLIYHKKKKQYSCIFMYWTNLAGCMRETYVFEVKPTLTWSIPTLSEVTSAF